MEATCTAHLPSSHRHAEHPAHKLGVNEAHLPENVQSEAARGQRICWRTPDRAAGLPRPGSHSHLQSEGRGEPERDQGSGSMTPQGRAHTSARRSTPRRHADPAPLTPPPRSRPLPRILPSASPATPPSGVRSGAPHAPRSPSRSAARARSLGSPRLRREP